MSRTDRPSDRASRQPSSSLRAGVIGVGSMGKNHARIYRELPDVDLVGVTDVDRSTAKRVATEYATVARSRSALLDRCDIVSVAVPTGAHATVLEACIDTGTHALVEKPVTGDPAEGRRLATAAKRADVRVQVGHVERFNPAVRTLAELIDDLEILALDARRLGPPIDRCDPDPVSIDLMIHDVDVLCSILDDDPVDVVATGTDDGQYATAALDFPDGVVATLTASRVTQRKIRRLSVTARECRVDVDYLDQTICLHRKSLPEYVTADGRTRYRHESIVEYPRVENGEPLRHEIVAFVDAVKRDVEPPVPIEDGVRALEIVRTIRDLETSTASCGPVSSASEVSRR